MTVVSGTRLGHYAIIAPLGAGGMGEVWVAEDTTLKRKVALKVLPAALAADLDRLARFQREAEVVAALNHPNIVTLHSVEQDGDVRFLTMELVEGQSLDRLIPRGGLPLAQVLEIGALLADALVASHEKGIIHRDLKPANVMLTRDRRVKVLDFGLAKLREEAVPDAETATAHRTGEGQVMGTVAHMSPEQAEGRPVDARSDLFSLGIVLFEMATGERPFTGDTHLAVLSAILRDTPMSVTDVRADLPREFARLVKRCLQKDPDQRVQTAKDVRNELQWLKADLASGATGAAAGPPAAGGSSGRRWRGIGARALAIVAAAIVLSTLGVWAWSRFGGARSDSAVVSPVAFEVRVPEGDHWARGLHPAISSDGRRIAYVAEHNGAPQLYVRTLSQVDARPLPGTEGAAQPFFSPDGRHVASFADHQLKSTTVGGGPPHVICPAPVPRGGAWGDDEAIVFAAGFGEGLSRSPLAAARLKHSRFLTRARGRRLIGFRTRCRERRACSSPCSPRVARPAWRFKRRARRRTPRWRNAAKPPSTRNITSSS